MSDQAITKGGNPNWHSGMKSPNPGGRPRGLERRVRDIVGEDVDLMIAMLRDIALNRGTQVGFHIRDRLKAFELLFDRGWGKARQTVDVTTEAVPTSIALDGMSDDELETLVGVLEGRIIDVPSIDVTPPAPALEPAADNRERTLAEVLAGVVAR